MLNILENININRRVLAIITDNISNNLILIESLSRNFQDTINQLTILYLYLFNYLIQNLYSILIYILYLTYII